jgi:hypothetical protein
VRKAQSEKKRPVLLSPALQESHQANSSLWAVGGQAREEVRWEAGLGVPKGCPWL